MHDTTSFSNHQRGSAGEMEKKKKKKRRTLTKIEFESTEKRDGRTRRTKTERTKRYRCKDSGLSSQLIGELIRLTGQKERLHWKRAAH